MDYFYINCFRLKINYDDDTACVNTNCAMHLLDIWTILIGILSIGIGSAAVSITSSFFHLFVIVLVVEHL